MEKQVSDESALIFPQGLVGCPQWIHFHLLPEPFENCGELLSDDVPGLGFLVADPAFLGIRYNFELDEDDVEALQLDDAVDANILCVLTIHREPVGVTANLAGPLVINSRKRIGRQVVLDHADYPLRAPVLTGEAARVIVDNFATGEGQMAATAGDRSGNDRHQTPIAGLGKGA